jgi:hypothetical protein
MSREKFQYFIDKCLKYIAQFKILVLQIYERTNTIGRVVNRFSKSIIH